MFVQNVALVIVMFVNYGALNVEIKVSILINRSAMKCLPSINQGNVLVSLNQTLELVDFLSI